MPLSIPTSQYPPSNYSVIHRTYPWLSCWFMALHIICGNPPSPFSLWPIKSWFGRGISLKASTHWGQIWYNTNEMKMTPKLQNNYSKTICHEFPRICCPEIPNKSLQLIGFDLKGPGQIEWIGRIWPLRLPIACRLLHSSLFLGHVSSTQDGSLSDFKYGFDTAKHDKCLEKKDKNIVLGKLRLPRLPWWSLVVWTTRIHL